MQRFKLNQFNAIKLILGYKLSQFNPIKLVQVSKLNQFNVSVQVNNYVLPKHMKPQKLKYDKLGGGRKAQKGGKYFRIFKYLSKYVFKHKIKLRSLKYAPRNPRKNNKKIFVVR